MALYQHSIPQRDIDHAVLPIINKARKQVCATCGKPVMQVPSNEGPESLKALLYLGPLPRGKRR